MDLTDMMKEASIIDHSWADSPGGMVSDEPFIDVERLKCPNNIKSEIEVQWGGGGPEIDIDEPAGIVERNLGEEQTDADAVILFARDMMNRGFMGRDLDRVIRSKFDAETIRAASSGLASQLRLEGIVGCVAIDGRGYDSCKDALRAAQQSPYKGLLRYVIGCECGTPHLANRTPRGDLLGVGESITGSAVDDFLESTENHKAEMIPVCQSTALPILGQDELDPSEVNDSLIDLTTVTELPQKIVDAARERGGIKGIQSAFRWLQAAKEARALDRYAGSVDASEFAIQPTDMSVDITPAVKREPIAMNSQPNRGFDVEVHGAGPSVDGIIPMNGASDQLVVEIGNKFVAQDIETDVFLEDEFEGTDQVELEDYNVPVGELDVEF
jgi:hypothetical protein